MGEPSTSAADNGPASSETRDDSQPDDSDTLDFSGANLEVSETRTRYQEHIQPEPRERGDEDHRSAEDCDDDTIHKMDGSTTGRTQNMPTPLDSVCLIYVVRRPF